MADFPCPRCNTDQGWYQGPNNKKRCRKCFWEREDLENTKDDTTRDKLVKQPAQKVTTGTSLRNAQATIRTK